MATHMDVHTVRRQPRLPPGDRDLSSDGPTQGNLTVVNAEDRERMRQSPAPDSRWYDPERADRIPPVRRGRRQALPLRRCRFGVIGRPRGHRQATHQPSRGRQTPGQSLHDDAFELVAEAASRLGPRSLSDLRRQPRIRQSPGAAWDGAKRAAREEGGFRGARTRDAIEPVGRSGADRLACPWQMHRRW